MKKKLIIITMLVVLIISTSVVGINYFFKERNPAQKLFIERTNLQKKKKSENTKSNEKNNQANIMEDITEKKNINVPTILQHPQLPHGCEITSLAAVLNFYGYKIDKMDLAKQFLPTMDFTIDGEIILGPNPDDFYAGFPWEESGWYCNAKPIVEAANSFFQSEGIWDVALDYSGKTREEILDEITKGNPVIIWVTIDLEIPIIKHFWNDQTTGEPIYSPINSHTVVLKGYDGKNLLVMDPLKGDIQRDANAFFESYYDLGGYAVILDNNR